MTRPGSAARVGVAAWLLAATASAGDLPEIQERGALRVLAVVDTAEPEFFSLRSQAAPGLDAEILLGFAKAQRVELKVVPATGWAGLVPALFEGKGDLVAGRVAATSQRRKLIAFTQEVFPSRNVVVTRRPHPGVRTLEQLEAERVGTIAGTSMYEALLAHGLAPARIDATLGSGELSQALRSGKVSAAVWWLEGAVQAQRRDAELELGLLLGPPESLAFGVRREDGALLDALNAHIEVVRSSGTWNRLAVKYFGNTVSTVLKRARED